MPVTAVSYRIDDSFEYGLRGAQPQKLVPTVLTLRASGVALRRVPVSLDALPFGLLSTIELRVVGGDGTTPFPVPFIMHVSKSTGSRSSHVVTPDVPPRVSVVSGPLCVDQDAVDEDLRAVLRETGHAMAFRAVAAGTIMCIDIEFPEAAAPPPPDFDIVMCGANMLPFSADVAAEMRAARPRLGFPYLSVAQRKARIDARLAGHTGAA